MQYALVDNERKEAFIKGKGICELCGSILIAKCGPKTIHHWAHYKIRNCDPWWENETEWHREWKNKFSEESREISHISPEGEIHRADIKTNTGIYIEVQHSNISDAERKSREEFYKNLVWIVDGRSFKQNFDIYHMLPDPVSKVAEDIVWKKAARHMEGANYGVFLRLSENPTETKASLQYGLVHSYDKIRNEIEESYSGYHQYDWVRPRQTWLASSHPIYIDFGDRYLVQLVIYDESNLKCVRLVSKEKFLHDVITETDVKAIATKFYTIK
jgi:competence protein CoiA